MSWTSSSTMTPTFLALIMMEKVKMFMLVGGQLEPPLIRGPLLFKDLFFDSESTLYVLLARQN